MGHGFSRIFTDFFLMVAMSPGSRGNCVETRKDTGKAPIGFGTDFRGFSWNLLEGGDTLRVGRRLREGVILRQSPAYTFRNQKQQPASIK